MISIDEPYICASRGRPIDNPNSRESGLETSQRIEINTSGCSNCLTTVQKDNWVIEPNKIKIIECSINPKHQQDLIQHQDGLCRCIPAGTHGSTPHLLKTLIIGDNYGNDLHSTTKRSV